VTELGTRFSAWTIVSLDPRRERVLARCQYGTIRQIAVDALMSGASTGFRHAEQPSGDLSRLSLSRRGQNEPEDDGMTVQSVVDNADAAELDEREQRIENAERDAYLVRGQELRAIRDGKLYRLRYNFPTFIEYCEQRWELSEVHADRLIGAASFASKVLTSRLDLPSRETDIRPLLTRLEADDDRIAVWRDVLATTNGAKIRAADVDDAISRFLALRNKEYVTLDEWRELDEGSRETLLNRTGKKGLNKQDNTDIEWANWSWNPITGCLHGCPYCYARDIAFNIYPEEVGFAPALWPDRLTAPANQKLPKDTADPAHKNIFSCSMADLFGRWVPGGLGGRGGQSAVEFPVSDQISEAHVGVRDPLERMDGHDRRRAGSRR
jgi:hypothetical protein